MPTGHYLMGGESFRVELDGLHFLPKSHLSHPFLLSDQMVRSGGQGAGYLLAVTPEVTLSLLLVRYLFIPVIGLEEYLRGMVTPFPRNNRPFDHYDHVSDLSQPSVSGIPGRARIRLQHSKRTPPKSYALLKDDPVSSDL